MNNFDDKTKIIPAAEIDKPKAPVPADKPNYKEYSAEGYTDRDLIYRFAKYLPNIDVEKLNTKLNKGAIEYSGASTVCPNCGKHLDLIGNDGHFCKFCGQLIEREPECSFGQAVKTLRINKKINQSTVAEGLGISNTKMCFLEQGKASPDSIDLNRLTQILKCSKKELFGMPAPRIVPEKQEIPIFQAITEYRNYETATFTPTEPVKVRDIEGYDNEYIYTCPFCREEIDLSPGEALSINLSTYETMRYRSDGNDGNFCKHCGQAIKRPVLNNEKKMFKSYAFWIKKAI